MTLVFRVQFLGLVGYPPQQLTILMRYALAIYFGCICLMEVHDFAQLRAVRDYEECSMIIALHMLNMFDL
jgi:hypothetical protein